MASGVTVHDDVVTKFNDMKLRSSAKYIIFKLNDTFSEIVVEKVAPIEASYDDFIKDIPKDDCRYAVFDFDFTTKEGGKRNKLTFFVWAPNTAKIKPKMLYASSKDAIRKKLVGIATEIQATDASEIDFEEVLDKVSSRDK
eukprot:Opistho-1_new@43474